MNYADRTDRQLLIRATQGDERAFARLYRRYATRITAYLYKRCGREQALAEDLCQQVFLQLLESKAFATPTEGPDRLDSLLFSMAANLLKNTYRSQARRETHLAHYRSQISTDDPAPDRLPPEYLTESLRHLPPAQREVVELRYRDGLTTPEIAELLDCAPGTVKSRLHYGLRKLATWLTPKINTP